VERQSLSSGNTSNSRKPQVESSIIPYLKEGVFSATSDNEEEDVKAEDQEKISQILRYQWVRGAFVTFSELRQ